MSCELEVKERLIEEYDYNLELLQLAERENAAETANRIKRKLSIIAGASRQNLKIPV